jgi:G3E family GTPase
VTVLTGFLGAGKTRLICRLLEQTSLRITAIVNDVASINVDAAQIRSRNAETIEFQNGCACCVLQVDLRETLEDISSRETRPDVVLIEASGIADPMGIAQTVANVPGAVLDGIVTLVDVASFRSTASDPSTASLFVRQIAAAHLVVLTKTDAGSDIPVLAQEIGNLAPGRPVLACDDLLLGGGETACEILLGAAVRGARPSIANEHHEHSAFAVETRTWIAPLPSADFFESLDRTPESLYRMKGSVWLRGEPEETARRVDVQVVGPRWRVTDAETQAPESHLVLIGRAEADSFTEYAETLGRL